jgi:hypothetical protein
MHGCLYSWIYLTFNFKSYSGLDMSGWHVKRVPSHDSVRKCSLQNLLSWQWVEAHKVHKAIVNRARSTRYRQNISKSSLDLT